MVTKIKPKNAPDGLWQRYSIYVACANDGKGGDVTRNGKPLKSFDEWVAS